MISLVPSPATHTTTALTRPLFYNRTIASNHIHAPWAMAVYLSLALATNGCQLTTSPATAAAQAQEIHSYNEQLTTIYSDLSSALGTYFPLGYTQFAVLDQDSTSEARPKSSNSTNATSRLLPEQALARALALQGASVCQTSQACDLSAQTLTTTITPSSDYILVELFAPEITLQRLYNQHAQALSPISLYGTRTPINTAVTSRAPATTSLAHHNRSSSAESLSTTPIATTTTTTTTTNTAHKKKETSATGYASSKAKNALLTHQAMNTAPASETNTERSLPQPPETNQETTTTAMATSSLNTTPSASSVLAPASASTPTNVATNTDAATTAGAITTTADASAPQDIAPTQPVKTDPPAAKPHPQTMPTKTKKPLHLGPLQTATNDEKAPCHSVDAPNTDSAASASTPTLSSTAEAKAPAATAPAPAATTKAHDAIQVELAATIPEEQNKLLAQRYHFASPSPTPISFSTTKPARYSHRSPSATLPHDLRGIALPNLIAGTSGVPAPYLRRQRTTFPTTHLPF